MSSEHKMNRNAGNRSAMRKQLLLSAAALMLLSVGGCALMREDTEPLNQIAVEQIRLMREIGVPQDTWPSALW